MQAARAVREARPVPFTPITFVVWAVLRVEVIGRKNGRLGTADYIALSGNQDDLEKSEHETKGQSKCATLSG